MRELVFQIIIRFFEKIKEKKYDFTTIYLKLGLLF